MQGRLDVPILTNSGLRENILLVGGAANGSVKFDFIAGLIAQCASTVNVIGIKLSTIQTDPVLERMSLTTSSSPQDAKLGDGGFVIIEETTRTSGGEAAYLLGSGASRAFWLQAAPDGMQAGLKAVLGTIPVGAAIICESDATRNFLDAGQFIVVNNSYEPIPCPGIEEEHDLPVHVDGYRKLAFVDGRWLITQDATAIILSGGKSTRLGQDKSLLPYRGIPLIAHIAAQLKPMFRNVIISTNDPEKYDFLGLPMIADRQPGQGPLMGIASTLGYVAQDLSFVIGCDIPIVNYRFVQRMISLAEGYDIVMPRDVEGRYEPLFAVYRRGVRFAALEILEAGERRIAALFERVRVRFVEFDGGDWYKNINTMDDYFTASRMSG